MKEHKLHFPLYYAISYMTTAVYVVFIPIFLNGLGYSRTLVGTLLALGPFIALLAHPAWGIAADRATSKNTVLFALILGASASILLFPLAGALPFVFLAIVLFSAFQSSIIPLSDAIALEHLSSTGRPFGPVRLAGTLGYAVMAVVAGVVARQRIDAIFPLYAAMGLLSFLVAFGLPKVRGHQSAGTRVPLRRLFEDRGLVLLLAFNFTLQLTLGFYYSFFAIHLKSLGADLPLQGWAIFITSLAELPFLIFADRILARLGTRLTMLLAGLALALRWFLFYLVDDRFVLMGVNALHGITVIVFIYSMATYINTNVRKELRASGQAMNAMLCVGVARVLGSVGGGFVSDLTSIRQTFLLGSVVALVGVVVFGGVFFVRREGTARDPGRRSRP